MHSKVHLARVVQIVETSVCEKSLQIGAVFEQQFDKLWLVLDQRDLEQLGKLSLARSILAGEQLVLHRHVDSVPLQGEQKILETFVLLRFRTKKKRFKFQKLNKERR